MVEAGGLRYLPDRKRLGRQLRERPSQPILARRGPLFGRWLRSYHGRGRGLLGRRKWRGGPIARPTSSAHDHRLLTLRALNLELTPAASRAANRAPPSRTLDLRQILRRMHMPIQDRRSAILNVRVSAKRDRSKPSRESDRPRYRPCPGSPSEPGIGPAGWPNRRTGTRFCSATSRSDGTPRRTRWARARPGRSGLD